MTGARKDTVTILPRINSSPASDRRHKSRRTGVDEHGIVQASIGPAHDASVIDVSAEGTLIEATHRLLPGTCVELHLVSATEGTEIIRGRVLRCCVTQLTANGIRYRGAIAFERELPWFAEDGPWVCDSQTGDLTGEVVVWPDATAGAPPD
jgi:hypothetical protein